MPSQFTHLSIAKRYMAKHPGKIKDVQRFLDGSVIPDLAPDKGKAHYGIRTEYNNLVKRNLEKVHPEKFLAEHDLSDDLDKGQYLHLYTDYQFYNVFLRSYFENTDARQTFIDLYEVTQRDDEYMHKKYDVDDDDTSYGDEIRALKASWYDDHHGRFGFGYPYSYPYSFEALDNFIEEMSDLDF